LGLIAVQPQHGYDLVAHFQSPEQLGCVWTMSQSQIYNVLKRLENQGFIVGQQVESEVAPTRTEYSITLDGIAELDAWLFEHQPSSSVRGIRVEFVSKLHICRLVRHDPEPIIAKQRAECVRQRDRILIQRERSDSVTEGLALDFVISQLNAAIAWLDGMRVPLEGRVGS
jgi:DNA-binding PadR family transcriptional regulator